jgi:hypothetical protein
MLVSFATASSPKGSFGHVKYLTACCELTTAPNNQMVNQKQLVPDSMAIADGGQGMQDALMPPSNEWQKLARVPGGKTDVPDKKDWLGIFMLVMLGIWFILMSLALVHLTKLLVVMHRIQ